MWLRLTVYTLLIPERKSIFLWHILSYFLQCCQYFNVLYPVCWNIALSYGGSFFLKTVSHPCKISLSLRGLPSSFKGAHGKIHYRLSGKLSKSKRAASKAEAKFTFVARADYDHSTLMVWSQFLSVRPEKYSKPHFNARNTKQTYVDQ